MPEYSSDYNEPEQGNILSRIPMWGWIAGIGILVLVLFVMGRGSSSSGSQGPLLATNPDSGNTSTASNFNDALAQLAANQAAMAAAIKGLTGGGGGSPPSGTDPTNGTPSNGGFIKVWNNFVGSNPTMPVTADTGYLPTGGLIRTLPAPATQGPATRFYTVTSGDSLRGIASKYYGNDANTHVIYNANRDIIGNDPTTIRPGQQLVIP